MQNDFIAELGLLSFVTRLKRLSDAMIHDGRRMYKELGLDIEPNWFVIFKLLEQHEELTVTEIANKIGFSHPSVISIVNKMIKANYLEEQKCEIDSRRRLIKLTAKAKGKLPEFEKVWDAGVTGMKLMLGDLDALNFLDIVENRVSEKGFKQRTLAQIPNQKEVQVVEFEKQYSADFGQLNYEWISDLFEIEQHDREILDHPEEYIIDQGGQIFLALFEGKAVGTVALIKEGNSFELAKMAVSSQYRGLKIGDKLMSACLEYARKVGIEKVFLLSNRKLIAAINLYKKFGFQEVPIDPNTSYKRTNIQMELILN